MHAEFPSIAQLKRAIEIEEKIEELKKELRAVLGGTGFTASPAATSSNGAKKDRRGGRRSAATRAKMAAAQQARWAKKNGTVALAEVRAVKSAKSKKKRTLSPEARAKIAEAQKKRWAAVKATS